MKKETVYQICTRCVMDTTDPDIVFDENGVCNHCHEYEEKRKLVDLPLEEKQKKLGAFVAQIKKDGEGKLYDCITGVSGGVDSTYAVYLLKQLGLRPLVVHLDNGWNSELAVQNIENIITRLGFDLYTKVLDWNEFKELQVAYLKASVLDLEALTDHAISATLYEQAAKNGIKYIMAGTNTVTEAILPVNWRYANKTNDAVNIKGINNLFRKKPLKDFPLLSFQKYTWYYKVKKIQWFSLLDYYDFDKAEAKELIQRELGWRDYGGKHYESIITRFYQGYILPNKFNIDKRKAHLSTLVVSGQISREEAVAELQKPIMEEGILKQDLEYVPKKLGLTAEEFEHIMQQPPKSHYDYKTDLKIRELFFSLKKLFFKSKEKNN
jgi:N-acetyl sugar amidotransferase